MGRLIGLFFATAILAGCSPGVARISRSVQAHRLGAVAVLPFAAPPGSVFADRVAYELLNNGATVVVQSRVAGLLASRGLGADRFGPDSSPAQLQALGRALHANTVVVGRVTGPPSKSPLLGQLQGFSGYPVTSAAIRFVRVSDGATVSYATYHMDHNIPLMRERSYEVARTLVADIVGP